MTPNVPTGPGAWRAAALRAVAAACAAALALAACGSSAPTDDSGVKKIAYLRSVATPDSPVDEALTDELLQRGFVEGENLAILGGSGTEVYPDPANATEAVEEWEEEGVDVIVAFSTSGAEIARDHAPGAKVLFLANDPQAAGFVKDERRPEGRMTGVTFRIPADRMLSLARRIIPGLRRIGLAYPPADPAAIPSRDQFAQAAQDQGLELIFEEFTDAADLPRAVGKLVQEGGSSFFWHRFRPPQPGRSLNWRSRRRVTACPLRQTSPPPSRRCSRSRPTVPLSGRSSDGRRLACSTAPARRRFRWRTPVGSTSG